MRISKTLVLILVLLIAGLYANGLFASSYELSGQDKTNYRSAKMYMGQEIYEKALPLFIAILENNPEHIETLENVAGIYYSQENYVKANEYYGKLITSIESVYAEYDSIKATDEKAAKTFYKKVIKKLKLDKKLENVTKLKASCWTKLFISAQDKYKAEDYEGALTEFTTVYEMAPDSSKTLKMLASIYKKTGDNEKSIEYLIKAAKADSTDAVIRFNIGNTFFNRGNYEEAVKWYNEAAKVNPQDTDSYFNAGLCYNNLKKPEEAINSFKKVVEIDPSNLDAVINISNIAFSANKLDESNDFMKKAIELDPENINYIKILSYRLFGQKQYDDAITYGKMWYNLDNTSKEAVQIIYLSAKNSGNKEVETEFEAILRKLQ